MRRVYASQPLRSVDTFSHDSAHINDLRANHVNIVTPVCGKPKPSPLDESIPCKVLTGLVRGRQSPERRAMHVHTIGPDQPKIDDAAGNREPVLSLADGQRWCFFRASLRSPA